MTATTYLDGGGSPNSGECADSFEGFTVETQDYRWAKPEGLTFRLQRILNLLDDLVELSQAISGFLPRSLSRDSYQIDFNSPAVTFRVVVHQPQRRFSSSASLSTVSRVISAFSIFVFP